MQVCEHCKWRFSFDCDDGLPYPNGGCDEFYLDYSTLSNEDRRIVQSILRQREEEVK